MSKVLPFLLGGAFISLGLPLCKGDEGLGRYYMESGDSPASRAVRVKRGGLAHTSLITVPQSIVGNEMETLVEEIRAIAEESGGSLAGVVKLNLYVSDNSPELLDQVKSQLVNGWPAGKRPALTIIPTRLPDDARIGGDAVIQVKSDTELIRRMEDRAAVMPSGRDMIYVSGRAASGELPEATSGTMKELFDVLAHLKATPADVIQVKAFIRPMTDWKIVETEISNSFGGNPVPPLVLVEWSSKSRATEIELIAAAPNQAETQMHVSYFTPPGEKISPVYSRVARIYAEEVIYVGGITAAQPANPEEEVNEVFGTLRSITEEAGSNLLHLVKGTYYVSEDEVSGKFNELRPLYYDPGRPPAASKVAVPSVGIEGSGLLLDMVAVPAE